MQAKKILETCIYSDKLEELKKFYTDTLGLVLHSEVQNRHLFFRCGDSMLMVFNPEETLRSDSKVPQHGASGPGHVAFAVSTTEFEQWEKHLNRKNIQIETLMDWPNGGKSLYFRDPSGNCIELATPDLWEMEKE
jgi:catechol 2,3-dioxygenase-like lactoylglutathione lyase family enzyme